MNRYYPQYGKEEDFAKEAEKSQFASRTTQIGVHSGISNLLKAASE